ncbi:MAG TPA: hypothetical protein VEL28_08895 [Candidatus Binatia bacterium]|nr:hypothetical protein [Candidatus Binatia bacterium]
MEAKNVVAAADSAPDTLAEPVSPDAGALEARPLAPLPSDYAFLVQLGRDTDFGAGMLVGQIEHLVSGRQARFAGREQMLSFMSDTLADVESVHERTKR